MQVISSKDNETIKNIRKLKDKKQRDEANCFIIEGLKLIEEAIQERANIKTIVICEECVKNNEIEQKLLYEIAKYECVYVTEKIFNTLTEVTNPQGMLAVIQNDNKNQEINFKEEMVIILDGIQDPGNLGTILRTIDSIGLTQVIVSKNTVDVYNPKVVRSTMGAIFRVNIIKEDDLREVVKQIKRNKIKVIATALKNSSSIYDIKLKNVAIIIGNEANGISKELIELADIKAKIPMIGKTESLNASVATGIILYEYVRQSLRNEK